MKTFKLNPGYFETDFLFAYKKYISGQSFEEDGKLFFIGKLIDREIEIRGLEMPEKTVNFPMDLNDRDLLFMNFGKRRIPPPQNIQILWAQYKYSILARDNEFYKKTGSRLAGKKGLEGFESLLNELIDIVFLKPDKGGLFNGILHMWGYLPQPLKREFEKPCIENMVYSMKIICDFAMSGGSSYLKDSTALPDFLYWAGYYGGL